MKLESLSSSSSEGANYNSSGIVPKHVQCLYPIDTAAFGTS